MFGVPRFIRFKGGGSEISLLLILAAFGLRELITNIRIFRNVALLLPCKWGEGFSAQCVDIGVFLAF
ncbi:MAG: hypothetical protein LBI68_03905 [Azoarcus sp.]|jgi:hypothetical protein|nr:hypothetical protein [Azoarcus sp.]